MVSVLAAPPQRLSVRPRACGAMVWQRTGACACVWPVAFGDAGAGVAGGIGSSGSPMAGMQSKQMGHSALDGPPRFAIVIATSDQSAGSAGGAAGLHDSMRLRSLQPMMNDAASWAHQCTRSVYVTFSGRTVRKPRQGCGIQRDWKSLDEIKR